MPIINFGPTEAQIYREYQITASGTASAAQELAFTTNSLGNVAQQQRVIVEARDDTIVFKFGGSSVTADDTVTSNALAAGNFSVTEGALLELDINGNTQTHVSVIATGSGGTAVIKLCAVTV